MKKDIHPEYHMAKVTCGGCGWTGTIGSTISEISVNVCSNCHPFFTGKQKFIDSEGRIDKFRAKYAKFSEPEKAAS